MDRNDRDPVQWEYKIIGFEDPLTPGFADVQLTAEYGALGWELAGMSPRHQGGWILVFKRPVPEGA